METLKRAVNYMQQVDKNGTYDELLQEVEQGEESLANAKAYCIGVLQRWHEDTGDQAIHTFIQDLIRSHIKDLLGLNQPEPTRTPDTIGFSIGGHEFEEKFLVVKWSDIGSILNMKEQYILRKILERIKLFRKLQGKNENHYLVVNTDETYASRVAEILVENDHCVK